MGGVFQFLLSMGGPGLLGGPSLTMGGPLIFWAKSFSITEIPYHRYINITFLYSCVQISGTWLVSMTQFNAFSCLLFKSDFMVRWYRNSVSRAPYTRTANLGGPGLMGGPWIMMGYLQPPMKPCLKFLIVIGVVGIRQCRELVKFQSKLSKNNSLKFSKTGICYSDDLTPS